MQNKKFQLYTDAGSRGNPGKAAAAAVLLDTEGKLIDTAGKYLGITTNNIAEYEGIILGLQLALQHHCKHLACFMDSQLVVKQINGEFRVKDQILQEKCKEVKKLIEKFDEIGFFHVYREKNAYADKLVNMILDSN